MQQGQNVIDAYNKTAVAYAAKYGNELKDKHLDRLLLDAFAMSNKSKGTIIDLGCGPGQTARFLSDGMIDDIIGTDISPEMVKVAAENNPGIRFEVADMLALPYPGASYGAAVAFYSIVHFDYEQVTKALNEVFRILRPGGDFLFSFHIGQEVLYMDTFLEQAVDLDFHFFEVDRIRTIATASGFTVVDIIERHPYTATEYPSRRAYFWLQKA